MAKCVVQYSGVFFGRLTPRPNSAALDVMGMSLLVECDIGESNYAYVQGYDVKVNDITTNNAKPQSELYSRVSCYSEKRGISPCMRAHSQENLASPAGKTALMSEYERRLHLQHFVPHSSVPRRRLNYVREQFVPSQSIESKDLKHLCASCKMRFSSQH